MNKDRIYVTERDMNRLRQLTDARLSGHQANPRILAQLEQELDRAEVLDDDEIPDGVITMNSRILMQDLDSGKQRTYQLVYPAERRISGEELSVLAPLGIALLGYQVGSIFEAETPGGVRRLKILSLLPPASAERKIA